jgi:hypothetical protein
MKSSRKIVDTKAKVTQKLEEINSLTADNPANSAADNAVIKATPIN